MKCLSYGNTNTFFISGLLVDTGYAGTLGQFYRALKANGVRMEDISYVLATHYHPDHMGLVGELMEQGVRLVLADVQRASVHFADAIFQKDRIPFVPVQESEAVVLSCKESRAFLARLGISGEIIHTPSHSPDSISLVLDNGDCLVGDLEPFAYLEAYEENEALKTDWAHILSHHPKRIYYGHIPPQSVQNWQIREP